MLWCSRGIGDVKVMAMIQKAYVGEAVLWISSIQEVGGDLLRRDDNAPESAKTAKEAT